MTQFWGNLRKASWELIYPEYGGCIQDILNNHRINFILSPLLWHFLYLKSACCLISSGSTYMKIRVKKRKGTSSGLMAKSRKQLLMSVRLSLFLASWNPYRLPKLSLLLYCIVFLKWLFPWQRGTVPGIREIWQPQWSWEPAKVKGVERTGIMEVWRTLRAQM